MQFCVENSHSLNFIYKITQMRTVIIPLSFLLPAIGMGQSIEDSVIATSGSYYANGQT